MSNHPLGVKQLGKMKPNYASLLVSVGDAQLRSNICTQTRSHPSKLTRMMPNDPSLFGFRAGHGACVSELIFVFYFPSVWFPLEKSVRRPSVETALRQAPGKTVSLSKGMDVGPPKGDLQKVSRKSAPKWVPSKTPTNGSLEFCCWV